MDLAPGHLQLERLGGFAGFGLPGSALRSRGQLQVDALPAAERQRVDALFAAATQPGDPAPVADAFRYVLRRHGPGGPQQVEVAEHQVPAALLGSLRDELA